MPRWLDRARTRGARSSWGTRKRAGALSPRAFLTHESLRYGTLRRSEGGQRRLRQTRASGDASCRRLKYKKQKNGAFATRLISGHAWGRRAMATRRRHRRKNAGATRYTRRQRAGNMCTREIGCHKDAAPHAGRRTGPREDCMPRKNRRPPIASAHILCWVLKGRKATSSEMIDTSTRQITRGGPTGTNTERAVIITPLGVDISKLQCFPTASLCFSSPS